MRIKGDGSPHGWVLMLVEKTKLAKFTMLIQRPTFCISVYYDQHISQKKKRTQTCELHIFHFPFADPKQSSPSFLGLQNIALS